MVFDFTKWIAAFALGAILISTTPSVADDVQLASLPDGGELSLDLPEVLDDKNLALYKQIFEVQERGRWKKADKLIKQLTDQTLMGHVQAQRYLHPTKYRSRYKELRRWLVKYHDHPQAKRIYDLAKKRRPKNALNPKRPSGQYLSGSGYDATGHASKVYAPRKRLSKAKARKAAGYTRKMRYYTRKGWTKSVKRLLRTKEVHQLLHRGQIDQARTWLAAGYYADGRDQWAYDWAQKAVKRSGKYIPTAHWVAGLASWRMGKREQAAHHFKHVTESKYSSDWMVSAGSYWAARAYLLERKPEQVNYWLAKAAEHPRTFYGLLANRALGYEAVFDWTYPEIDADELADLTTHKPGRRALALLQLGQDETAEKEFRKAYSKADVDGRKAMLAIAMRSNMPSFSMRLASQLARSGVDVPDGALYPLPKWQPKAGFKVDRALIFALMRQESGFNPKAKSYAGAKGLMQLMPGTASFVARDRRMRWSKKLFEPETNIHLGQNYINMLLEEKYIGGDLFHLTAAWNGGPGNLNKWKRGVKHEDDPLLFIESIPSRETRIFIERVLTNFWVYRDRMGQEAPTLDAIASGTWPMYESQDKHSVELAKN
ncbi:lytic transglycosylase domain-containing protein [Terasakiella sp. A23]|uniref:lytic transglycosylase domain-containing protein n=1 Tax=Terasakiella sp. FCG-A23 TaxID=3080561 RepID=UPI0029535A92|nr:lytic transglycosylase domain-containing protein [Terasakiella sp. A23]MDV7340734.1 lytic transglycosylase domain-containing protein [Terasakiella sp. A23]